MSLSWDDLVKDAGDVSSYEPLPEGDYDFEVKEAKATTTKTGKKMFSTTNKVVGGAYNGRQVWDNLVITTDNPNALRMFFVKMAALGLTPEYFKEHKPSDEQVVSALRGRRFRAKVGQRTYNGEKRNEISKYFSAPAAAIPGVAMTGAVPPPPAAAPAAPPPPAAAPPAAVPPPPAAAPPAPVAAPPAPPVAAAPPAAAPAPVDPWAQADQTIAAQAAPAPAAPPPVEQPVFTPPPAPATEVPATATQPPAAPAYAPPAEPAYAQPVAATDEVATPTPPPPPAPPF